MNGQGSFSGACFPMLVYEITEVSPTKKFARTDDFFCLPKSAKLNLVNFFEFEQRKSISRGSWETGFYFQTNSCPQGFLGLSEGGFRVELPTVSLLGNIVCRLAISPLPLVGKYCLKSFFNVYSDTYISKQNEY